MKIIYLYWVAIWLIVCNACVNQTTRQKEGYKDLNRIVQWGFPVTENYMQTYVGSFCYSSTFREHNIDYFVGYNKILHAVDILDLTNQKLYKQIRLDREGSNGVSALKGIDYYKGLFVIEDNTHFLLMDIEGKISSRRAKAELLERFNGYRLTKPGLFIYFSMYSFFLFNPETGEIAITLYADDPDKTPAKIVLFSCENWEVTETVDIDFPDYIRKEGNMGVLNCVNALPFEDKILYNFPTSSNIYSFNRKTRETTLFEIPSSLVENFLRVIESNNNEEDLSIISGYYFPLRYDSYRKKLWRIQMGKKSPEGSMYNKRPYAISCIGLNLKGHREYALPQELELYPNSLFFSEGILFPYIEAPEEEQIIFYLIKAN